MLINYLSESEELTGYRVKVMRREGFTLVGYTLIVQPDDAEAIPAFWHEVTTDGRQKRLLQCSSAPTWCLGLSSSEPKSPKHGQRYTIGIEATADTDFSTLAKDYPLFTKEIAASAWLCFELPSAGAIGQLWEDDPHRMLQLLGYRFNPDGPDVGLHVDAYPPDYDAETNPAIEFWITVKT
jgi:predicted transcriptional regulator YdeE